MTQKKKRARINVMMNEEILEKIDTIASNYGISRNAWIVQTLGQQALVTEKMFESINPELISEFVKVDK